MKAAIKLPPSCADCGSAVRARDVEYEIDGGTISVLVTFEPHRCKDSIGIQSMTFGHISRVTD